MNYLGGRVGTRSQMGMDGWRSGLGKGRAVVTIQHDDLTRKARSVHVYIHPSFNGQSSYSQYVNGHEVGWYDGYPSIVIVEVTTLVSVASA